MDPAYGSYELTLPEGYRAAMTVDAMNRKTVLLLNAAGLALTAVSLALSAVLIRPWETELVMGLWQPLVFLAAMLSYVVLHELTHGAAYSLLTRRKLSFGISLGCAWCGVPDIYVYRSAALVSLLSPFTLFTALFLAGALLLPGAWGRFAAAVLLALHLGGCAGDLYDTWLFLRKFRDPSVLMRDTGPKQTIYVKENSD